MRLQADRDLHQAIRAGSAEGVVATLLFVPGTLALSGFGGLRALIRPKSLMGEGTTGTNPTLSANKSLIFN